MLEQGPGPGRLSRLPVRGGHSLQRISWKDSPDFRLQGPSAQAQGRAGLREQGVLVGASLSENHGDPGVWAN